MHQTRKKIWSLTTALAAVGALALIGIIYGASLVSGRTEQLATSVADVGLAELKMNRAFTLVLEAESSQRGYLLANDAGYLDPFRATRPRAERNLAEAEAILQRLGPGADFASLTAVREKIAEKFSELERTVTLAQSGRRDEAMTIMRGNLGRDLMTQVRDLVAQEQTALGALRNLRLVELRDSAATLSQLSALGVAAVLVLALFAVSQLARQARSLALAQQQLASANDALEHRVAERTRDLRRANEELQRYAYIVSHDLRAPLVNIIGFTRELETAAQCVAPVFERLADAREEADVAEARRALREDIPEALKFIQSSTGRMDGLIAAILQLSRLGAVALHPEPLDLTALARECIASVQHRLNDADASAVIDGDLPALVGDRAALSQILGNLLDNAAKYLSDSRPGRIILRGRASGSRVRIEVEDNGRGVAPRDHQRIFELFRRSGKQDKPGDGIGLAHVRTLARRMGGDIEVRSDGVSGSVFVVTLPADLHGVLSAETRNE
ncbi:signal transduction histidine kinase [Rhodoblastus acidophilus]|uniref:sensor histidine kinase n=1 Tax=Rhodoblastus acidophilus TaxID=1074 RepID=UPI00222414FA|nr:ATP-binding protein [Rhodoblastus acidophilus]MCW2315468.1 signal transduction histidine kinase [Rhodoblastus acidophilus]